MSLDARTAGVLSAVVLVIVVALWVRPHEGFSTGDSVGTTASEEPVATSVATSSPPTATVAPATVEGFCAQFAVLVDAYEARRSNETAASTARVEDEAEALLSTGQRLSVSRRVRAGLTGFVQDIMREQVTPSPDELAAFSEWLPAACPR